MKGKHRDSRSESDTSKTLNLLRVVAQTGSQLTSAVLILVKELNCKQIMYVSTDFKLTQVEPDLPSCLKIALKLSDRSLAVNDAEVAPNM